MNILITGGAGYIGSAAAKALLKAGHQVTVYDSLATGHREAVPEGAIFIHADLCDLLTLGMALRDENYETVMHFAALRYFNACGALPGSDEAHQPESHLIPHVLNVALGLIALTSMAQTIRLPTELAFVITST